MEQDRRYRCPDPPQLAALLQPAAWTPPTGIYTELQQRLAQRETLLDRRQQVRNQLHALCQQPVVISTVRERMETLLATFSEHMRAVERELTSALRQDDAWAVAATRLQTITGVGMITVVWLHVTTRTFTACETVENVVSYAGLAPSLYHSGTSVRGRPTIGWRGNGHLRRALYLAILSAARYNPAITSFYERLRAAGKLAKVARGAAARTVRHIAWAVVTTGQDVDPNDPQRWQKQQAAAVA